MNRFLSNLMFQCTGQVKSISSQFCSKSYVMYLFLWMISNAQITSFKHHYLLKFYKKLFVLNFHSKNTHRFASTQLVLQLRTKGKTTVFSNLQTFLILFVCFIFSFLLHVVITVFLFQGHPGPEGPIGPPGPPGQNGKPPSVVVHPPIINNGKNILFFLPPFFEIKTGFVFLGMSSSMPILDFQILSSETRK